MKKVLVALALASLPVMAQETTMVLGRLLLDTSAAKVTVVDISGRRHALLTVSDRHGVRVVSMELGPKGLAELQRLLSGAQQEIARGGPGLQPPSFSPSMGPAIVNDGK